jgi:hypothetical protein
MRHNRTRCVLPSPMEMDPRLSTKTLRGCASWQLSVSLPSGPLSCLRFSTRTSMAAISTPRSRNECESVSAWDRRCLRPQGPQCLAPQGSLPVRRRRCRRSRIYRCQRRACASWLLGQAGAVHPPAQCQVTFGIRAKGERHRAAQR